MRHSGHTRRCRPERPALGRVDPGRFVHHPGARPRHPAAPGRPRRRRVRAPAAVPRRRPVGTPQRRRHHEGAVAGLPRRRPSPALRSGPGAGHHRGRHLRPARHAVRHDAGRAAGDAARRSQARPGHPRRRTVGVVLQGRAGRPRRGAGLHRHGRPGRRRRPADPPARRGRAGQHRPPAGPRSRADRPRRAGLARRRRTDHPGQRRARIPARPVQHRKHLGLQHRTSEGATR